MDLYIVCAKTYIDLVKKHIFELLVEKECLRKHLKTNVGFLKTVNPTQFLFENVEEFCI